MAGVDRCTGVSASLGLAQQSFDLAAPAALNSARIRQYCCSVAGFDLLYATQRVRMMRFWQGCRPFLFPMLIPMTRRPCCAGSIWPQPLSMWYPRAAYSRDPDQ